MEKFIPLPETNAGKMRPCNKETCAGCRHKQEILQQADLKEAGEKRINILQSHYAALLQYYSFPFRNESQDNGYIHCT